ncbi:hypothetical protein JTB14_021527 [Gonioctena quinquepunctata]|nr:hypothetical protein JTB14_021527 [Gonioctena quinquepunctata]
MNKLICSLLVIIFYFHNSGCSPEGGGAQSGGQFGGSLNLAGGVGHIWKGLTGSIRGIGGRAEDLVSGLTGHHIGGLPGVHAYDGNGGDGYSGTITGEGSVNGGSIVRDIVNLPRRFAQLIYNLLWNIASFNVKVIRIPVSIIKRVFGLVETLFIR